MPRHALSVVFTAGPAAATDVQSILNDLKNGNARFTSGKLSLCSRDTQEVRSALLKEQKPGAVVLSCSDSRVPPETIFDRGLGELFTVRVAGNILNDENIASIEYAVEHLGSTVIVVMGHDFCGAVKAALEYNEVKGAGSKSLNTLVEKIRANLGLELKVFTKHPEPSLRGPVQANIAAVVDYLTSHSPLIKAAVDSKRVKIVRAIYDLESGHVDFW